MDSDRNETFELLKAKVETSLRRNNPKKYKALKKSGELNSYLEDQAQQAQDAMSGAPGPGNEIIRRELAAEFLNPVTGEQEAEQSQEPEETPEEKWLRNRESQHFSPFPIRRAGIR